MSGERGFALITVVLIMIGLAVLATGLVFSASQHAIVVTSMHDVARARRGAEAAVELALARWSAAARSRDPLASAVALVEPTDLEPGVRIEATAQRLAGEAWIVQGTARVLRGGLPAIPQTAARIVRSLDVDSMVGALDAALITSRARVGAGAIVDGLGTAASAHGEDAAAVCGAWLAAGAALRAPDDSLSVSTGARIAGQPPLVIDSAVARFQSALGHLDLGALRGAAQTIDSVRITPTPIEAGVACDTGRADAWGAAAGPCASTFVLVRAADTLEVAGGFGQGVLIADGDLVLDGGFRFRGLIIGPGSVTIRDATVEGVIATGRIEMEGGSATLDRCAIADALASVASLRAAYPPARSWLPTFD